MEIKVASLNFSGINVSPFEYHDGSQEKLHLNHLFRHLLQRDFKDIPGDTATIARLDKSFQKGRYSLLYSQHVGVARGKLLTKDQFDIVWDVSFDASPHVSVADQATVDRLKLFDRVLYEAFLLAVFGEVDWSRIKEYDSQRYLTELAKWHSKAYLKLATKIKLLCDYINKKDLDILFIQEANVEEVAKCLSGQYTFTWNKESMIVIKKTLFIRNSFTQAFDQKFRDTLNFNDDTSFVRLKDFLVISVHLSSKKIKTQQAAAMSKTIQRILEKEPNLKVIIGMDANQFLAGIPSFSVFPLTDCNFTTRKKRTDMQLQFEKAGLVVEDVKDHLMTNLKLSNSKVETICEEDIGCELLPNERHPYDHFVVSGTITFEPVVEEKLIFVDLPSHNTLRKTDTISTATPKSEYLTFGSFDKEREFCQEIKLVTSPSCKDNEYESKRGEHPLNSGTPQFKSLRENVLKPSKIILQFKEVYSTKAKNSRKSSYFHRDVSNSRSKSKTKLNIDPKLCCELSRYKFQVDLNDPRSPEKLKETLSLKPITSRMGAMESKGSGPW